MQVFFNLYDIDRITKFYFENLNFFVDLRYYILIL